MTETKEIEQANLDDTWSVEAHDGLHGRVLLFRDKECVLNVSHKAALALLNFLYIVVEYTGEPDTRRLPYTQWEVSIDWSGTLCFSKDERVSSQEMLSTRHHLPYETALALLRFLGDNVVPY